MKKIIYMPKGEKYGFELFAANFGDEWGKIEPKDVLFIYFSDFEFLIDAVKSVYPITDPETNKIVEVFDVCGMNCIHSKAWDKIISELESKSYEDVALKNFISSFCLWVSEKKKTSDEIMVHGTL